MRRLGELVCMNCGALDVVHRALGDSCLLASIQSFVAGIAAAAAGMHRRMSGRSRRLLAAAVDGGAAAVGNPLVKWVGAHGPVVVMVRARAFGCHLNTRWAMVGRS